MQKKKEFDILNEFIRSRGLRYTSQRDAVLEIFLATEGHVSVEELHTLVKSKYPSVGYTTVYRAMKLLSELGLCRAVDFGDGVMRYEHEYGHRHHDHLICTQCGGCIEVVDPEIEKLQGNLAQKHKFTPVSHVLKIYGICGRCRRE